MTITQKNPATTPTFGLPDDAKIQTISLGDTALAVLSLPCADRDDAELLARARAWVEGESDAAPKGLLISLQGTQILWVPGRAAVLAPAECLPAVRPALVEFSQHEAALRAIEHEVEAGWPDLEADSPLAFDFHEKAAGHREELARRFQRVIGLRSRLARLIPQVHRPLIHPPTLASQISERLRQRTRLIDRLEFIGRQIEVFDHVYEMCSQRASDYRHARKGHTLEMIIIVMLAASVVLQIVDLLSTLSQ